MRRPHWPASGAAPQRSPEPGGTDSTAATHSPSAAGRPGTPAGAGHASRPSGHSAAGMGVQPGAKKSTFRHHADILERVLNNLALLFVCLFNEKALH